MEHRRVRQTHRNCSEDERKGRPEGQTATKKTASRRGRFPWQNEGRLGIRDEAEERKEGLSSGLAFQSWSAGRTEKPGRRAGKQRGPHRGSLVCG